MKLEQMFPEEQLEVLNGLKSNPMLEHLLQSLEQAAFERAVAAPINDNETRASACAEVRAVRNFSSRLLQEIAEKEQELRKSAT